MMIGRRHALMGLACLAAAGSAAALIPRRRLSLDAGPKLDVAIPRRFAGWEEQPTDALITPDDDDSLAARLYSQIVGRLYVDPSGAMVMLLIAYGDTQNDLLQLHRPEVCYPAFGFTIDDNSRIDIPLAANVSIPGRALTASSTRRIEQILYWTRIGEHLPTDGREQRVAKLKDQFAGVIADGVLVRISTITDDPREGLAINQRFARDLMSAMPTSARPMLIGTDASVKLPPARRA
jgi:EpsI family protein